jgi:hypothetical protein
MIKSKSFKTVTSKIQIYKLTQAFDFWIIKTFLTKSTAFHIKSHDLFDNRVISNFSFLKEYLNIYDDCYYIKL